MPHFPNNTFALERCDFRAGAKPALRIANYDFAAGAAGTHSAYNIGLKSCQSRAMGTHFVHPELELSALRALLLR